MSERKSEDEWFQKFEEEMIRDARRRRELETAQKRTEEDARLKEQHWMKCPKCGHDMAALQLEAITVDKCSHCEGVFFDRGELDDLLLHKSEARKGIFRRLAGLVG